MSKEKAKDCINIAVNIVEGYFEGNNSAKRITIKHLQEALKELEEEK